MKLRLTCCVLLSITTLAARAADAPATPAPNSAADATNEVAEAKAPESVFTNSVNMVLLKTAAGDFWAGQYEVTQAEFQKVMGANPSAFAGPQLPVDSVTWDDAMDFCKKLTLIELQKKVLPEGYHYILPTEDEWTNLVGDATLANAVTSLDNRRTSSSPVGSLGPNNLGLYDVRGNVMEFVLSDPGKPYRFLKGGSWADFADANLRPEFRWYCKPEEHLNTFGFRCLLKDK